ncbi:hypothetical protein HPB49_015294 [Dermacentor silvarum]|uniref:Uncharacterized protein n=1 Tax=Dermacentor silvarum TaxID=543639 RepID=A0ACB8DE92_DERSI|nr:hypothetical protein HPB49_015294 [Dermacentor silvarum]
MRRVGDSGYPLEPWLKTLVPGHPPTQTAEGKYNTAHAAMRSVVERCIGLLMSRFCCLPLYRTLLYKPERAANIFAACGVLHNLRMSEGYVEDDDESDDDSSSSSSGVKANLVCWSRSLQERTPSGSVGAELCSEFGAEAGDVPPSELIFVRARYPNERPLVQSKRAAWSLNTTVERNEDPASSTNVCAPSVHASSANPGASQACAAIANHLRTIRPGRVYEVAAEEIENGENEAISKAAASFAREGKAASVHVLRGE